MARKAREGTNGFEPEVVQDIMGRLDENATQLASLKGTYMRDAQLIRADKAAILDEAAEKGLPKRTVAKLFKARQRLASAKKIIADLEPDDRDLASVMADALGSDETAPLFVFAKATRGKRKRNGETASASA